MIRILVVFVAMLPLGAEATVPVNEAWRADISIDHETRSQAVETDSAGNSYVAGVSNNGVSLTRFIQKINTSGVEVWRFVSSPPTDYRDIVHQQLVVDETDGALYVVRCYMDTISSHVIFVAKHSLSTGTTIWNVSGGTASVPYPMTKTAALGVGAGGIVWVARQDQTNFAFDGLRWSIKYLKIDAATGAELGDGILVGAPRTDRYFVDLSVSANRLFVAYREQGATNFDLVITGFDIGIGSLIILNPHEPTPCSAAAPCRQEFNFNIPESTTATAAFTDAIFDANGNFAVAGYYEKFELDSCIPECFGNRYWYYPAVVKVNPANQVLFEAIEQGSSVHRVTSGDHHSSDITTSVTAAGGDSLFVLIAGEPGGGHVMELDAWGFPTDGRMLDSYFFETFSGGGCSEWHPAWQPRALAASPAGWFLITGQLPATCAFSGFATDLHTSRTVAFHSDAYNIQPVATAQNLNTYEDTPLPITLAGRDIDGTISSYSIARLPVHGTLSGAAPNLTYTPALYYHGPDSFTFMVNDGYQNSVPATVSINVTSVNDAPSGTDKTVTTLEDTDYTFNTTDFGFTDPDGNQLLAVKISTLPVAGSLLYNNVVMTAVNSISAADINLGKLKFRPAVDVFGAAYSSFKFQVQDDGGTANGGVDLDPTPNTITINVTRVNYPPTISAIGLQTMPWNSSYAVSFTVADVDNQVTDLTVTATSSNHTLLLDSSILSSGTDTTRYLTIIPVSDQFGDTTITVLVSDGTATTSTSFSLTVENTPKETNISVTLPSDVTIVSGVTVTLTATITFSEITTGGQTLVTRETCTARGFEINGQCYDISTTAVYTTGTGKVNVCISILRSSLTDSQVTGLQLWHFESGSWDPDSTPTTVTSWVDVNGIEIVSVCRSIDSLSLFAVIKDTTPPVLTVPPDITSEATAPRTLVDIGQATATDLFPVTITNNAPAAGFPVGTTTVVWTAVDPSGNKSTGAQRVTIKDTTPPTFMLNRLKDTLWPPDHKLVKVATVTDVHDIADPSPKVDIQVTSRDVFIDKDKDKKEKDDHKLKDRDDDTDHDSREHHKPDWEVKKRGSTWEVWVRAERPGKTSERIYTITATVTDKSGNAATKSTTVTVLHDEGKR